MNACLSIVQLTINGRIYKHDTMNQLQRDRDRNGKITSFITAAFPLSNHYECEIRDEDGVIWPHAESYYLSLKAKHFNDDHIIHYLLKLKTQVNVSNWVRS